MTRLAFLLLAFAALPAFAQPPKQTTEPPIAPALERSIDDLAKLKAQQAADEKAAAAKFAENRRLIAAKDAEIRKQIEELKKKLAAMGIELCPTPGPVPPKPPEPKPPEPKPPVPPPVPIPASEFRVLFLYESSANLTEEQINIMGSTRIRGYLNRTCVKGADGKTPEYRYWDKDAQLKAKPNAIWEQIWTATKPALPPLPAVVIFNGSKGESFELPATEAATLTLLKSKGGD